MSEYQYYEFRAVDRPLTADDMDWLRELSSRAQITPTGFANTYNWGDFRGDPVKLMHRCFDAFVHVTNFGCRRFMLRLPHASFDIKRAKPYCRSEITSLRSKGNCVLLDFYCEDEPGEWDEWDDGPGWMASLIPLRADLLDGDWRCLYLAWLCGVQYEDLEDDLTEPAVPPGLKDLPAPYDAFVDFLQIDMDLVEVAARRSTPRVAIDPSTGDLKAWIDALPTSDKDDLLVGFVQGTGANPQRELLRRYREATADRTRTQPGEASFPPRTVAELADAWNEHARAKERRLAEQAERERARHAEAEARAREKYLKDLASRTDAVWSQIEALAKKRTPKGYNQAVALLADLRDAAAQTDGADEFARRIQQLRSLHSTKPSLMRRLHQAGLW